ncbi:MAG: hypothetical protein ACLSE6_05605 [Alphaproteobacteria bacterium]
MTEKMIFCGMDYPVKPDNDREKSRRCQKINCWIARSSRAMTEREERRAMTQGKKTGQ